MNLVQHPDIHKALFKRWEELGLKSADVIRDAEERGMRIDASRLSVYKKMIETGKHKGAITTEHLAFLCLRWGIHININIGSPVIHEGKIEYKVLPYDELSAIKRLNHAFPHLKK